VTNVRDVDLTASATSTRTTGHSRVESGSSAMATVATRGASAHASGKAATASATRGTKARFSLAVLLHVNHLHTVFSIPRLASRT